jgi:hypothetical protein
MFNQTKFSGTFALLLFLPVIPSVKCAAAARYIVLRQVKRCVR